MKQGKNIITILYANEFHNKSHPHEGAIVKYSGVYNPFLINGVYKNGSAMNIKIEQFYVKQDLTGRNAGFHKCGFDDSKWQTAPDTEKFVIDKALGHVVWFRRKFLYNPENGFSAPLYIIPKKADERLLIFINGKAVALYDIIGPQEKFYIPDSYLNKNAENTIAMILECPGFFEEIMSGYRRGYLYNPVIEPAYVAKDMKLQLTSNK